MSALGVKIDEFSVPVCNCFKPKIIKDQLCYEMDPNKYITEETNHKAFQTGIILLISYNEDRQTFQKSRKVTKSKNIKNSLTMSRKHRTMERVFLGTKGKFYFSFFNLNEKSRFPKITIGI